MAGSLPVGPYKTLQVGGHPLPYFIIPFDRRGLCDAPRTRDALLELVDEENFSDIFVFSHGWNNDWATATARYESFIEGFSGLRSSVAPVPPDGYRPLLVGVFWPSTALVWDKEEAPEIAGGMPQANDQRVVEERSWLEELAATVDEEGLPDLYELAQMDGWSGSEALRFAELIRPLYLNPSDEDRDDPPTPEDIVNVWGAADTGLGGAGDLENFDLRSEYGFSPGSSSAPDVAGLGDAFRRLVPRRVLRLLTVYQMKDRAGKVGTKGVAPLLDAVLGAPSEPRLHLIGHSYGGKVVLSATAGLRSEKKIHSMLLLQPAVNHLCFARQVPGEDYSGGYHMVPSRVVKPILSTFSQHDVPLTKTFHLALRRSHDLGEARIAARGGNDPPSPFCALGGFGPRGAEEELRPILDPGEAYPELSEDSPPEVIGIDGTRTIGGHGDVSNESTWWALHQLVAD